MGRDLSKFELRYGKPIKQGYIRFGIKLCMSAKRYCYVFYTLHETPDKDDLLRWELDFHPEVRGHRPLTWGYPFVRRVEVGKFDSERDLSRGGRAAGQITIYSKTGMDPSGTSRFLLSKKTSTERPSRVMSVI